MPVKHCRVCGNEVKPKRRKAIKPKPKVKSRELPPVDLVRNVNDLLSDDSD